jgi:hypothetical protein
LLFLQPSSPLLSSFRILPFEPSLPYSLDGKRLPVSIKHGRGPG